MSSSRIEQLIDELESYVDGCKYKPFSSTQIIVDKEEIDGLIRELRMKTPDEIKRYQKIISNKEAILNDARAKADELVKQAAVQTNELISEHEIMQQAYAQAQEVVQMATAQAQDILTQAAIEANDMRNAAVTYTDSLLANIEDTVFTTMNMTKQHYESFYGSLNTVVETVRQNREALRPVDDLLAEAEGVAPNKDLDVM